MAEINPEQTENKINYIPGVYELPSVNDDIFSIDINPLALSVLNASLIAVRLTSNWLHSCISVGNRSPEASFLVKIASSISEAIFLLNDSLFPIDLKILVDLRHHMYYMLPNLINLISFVKLNFS